MAFIPFLAFGPTALVGLIGLIHGPDKTIPTPAESWKDVTVDLLIPSYNEEKTIVLCIASIMRQSLKPRQIFIIDDASKDRTIQYVKSYAQLMDINLIIIQREHNEGKTPSIYHVLHESDADVVVVVDADTVLRSDNYLERLVQELYQGVGIASSCGVILPFTEKDRNIAHRAQHLDEFHKIHPDFQLSPDKTWFQRLQRTISNSYREELYLFLQRFIYHGEMVFFGTIIFPIGCACAYRREYLKTIFDHYHQFFGFDLTTSEDIFFGFAFATEGYRNIVVQDVYAFTMEPRFLKFYNQTLKWSSSFFQSCYYFNDLFLTPFKFPRYLIKKIKDRRYDKIQQQKRKIKEAYRQPFGGDYTKKYGRNIGWFVFTTAIEKITFPIIILILIILRLWLMLFITIGTESLLYTFIIAFMHKNRRIKNLIKAILYIPIRYSQLMFDLFVMAKFMVDLWITKNRRWRK